MLREKKTIFFVLLLEKPHRRSHARIYEEKRERTSNTADPYGAIVTAPHDTLLFELNVINAQGANIHSNSFSFQCMNACIENGRKYNNITCH